MSDGSFLNTGFSPHGLRCRNDSGDEIPPRGVCQLRPVTAERVGQTTGDVTFFSIQKPNLDDSFHFGLNGPARVPVNGYATIELAVERPCLGLLSQDFDLQDAWSKGCGPIDDSWEIGEGDYWVFSGVFDGYPYTPYAFVQRTDQALVPAIITQGLYPDTVNGEAVYRTSHEPDGFEVKRLDTSLNTVGNEFLAHGDLMKLVHWTGSKVVLQRFGGRWYVITTGAPYWGTAIAQEDIITSGEVALWSVGPRVTAINLTDGGISAGTSCRLFFDEQAQQFHLLNISCPNYVVDA